MEKKWFITIFLGLIMFSCRSDNEAEISISQVSHIQFFGFTLIDTLWDDPTDSETTTNYKDEVYSFSNVSDILVVAPEDDIVDRMNAFADLDMKSILHLNELFFEITGTNNQSGTEYGLRADYKQRWNQFTVTNRLNDNKGLIGAFYIGEEPTWHGISFEELRSATDYVKGQFPNIPIMLVEAYPALTNLQVPESVDWIGFDHYFIKDPNTDATYQEEWALLKSKRSTTNQRIVLIMDTHYILEGHGTFGNIALEEMQSVALNYYELAKSDTSVITIFGYFWPNGFDAATAIGARGMPEAVREEYIRIGKEISKKN